MQETSFPLPKKTKNKNISKARPHAWLERNDLHRLENNI